jgi:hypothetical protein
MSIYSTPLPQLTNADLQELLQDGAVENVRLEFKREVPSKEETLKKFSSFANTFGGFIVVGASANSSDGRIEALPGVEEQNGYKQKIVDWCFTWASPSVTVEVSHPIPTRDGPGKFCYVVHVPESDVAPHFLNGRKGVWVRTDEFSARFEARLADENELRHLFDRRKLILERRAHLLERAKRRFGTFISRMHTDLGGSKTPGGSRLEFCIVPRFPARPVCDQSKLKPLVEGNTLTWRGYLFPRFDRNAIVSQHESALVFPAARKLSIFEVNIWGMLFYGTKIDGDHNGTFGIHLYEFVGHVLAFIKHAGDMLPKLGYSGPILVETALASVLGVPWLYAEQGGFPASRPGSELDDSVEFSISTTSEALRDRPDGVAMDVLRYVFFSVNWPGLVEGSNLENLVRFGYQYNSWPPPNNLRI